jgi:hypothetical protein
VTAGETPTLSDKAAGMAPQSYLTQQCHSVTCFLTTFAGARDPGWPRAVSELEELGHGCESWPGLSRTVGHSPDGETEAVRRKWE